jgi:hypothetical protein
MAGDFLERIYLLYRECISMEEVLTVREEEK